MGRGRTSPLLDRWEADEQRLRERRFQPPPLPELDLTLAFPPPGVPDGGGGGGGGGVGIAFASTLAAGGRFRLRERFLRFIALYW